MKRIIFPKICFTFIPIPKLPFFHISKIDLQGIKLFSLETYFPISSKPCTGIGKRVTHIRETP